MSITQSLTMANTKPEHNDHSSWQGYSFPPASSTSQPPVYASNYHSPALSIPYHGRPAKGSYRSLDTPSSYARLPPRGGNSILTASPPPLNTHHSYPSLKRAFQSGEDDDVYAGNIQRFREDLPEPPKPSINQDHRLLSFGRRPDKYTILDSQGRVQRVELRAQIHGMFFLSELATPSGESLVMQPELTCYRRNLFQISGNVTASRGSLFLMTDRGERVPIVSMEVAISATESVDGHVIRLIVIPWKTPPPNSTEIPTGQEHEPRPIPLLPSEESLDTNSHFTVFPMAYRRLQFRIATANNGRRRELQQHFTLHLNVIGTLANGTKVNVCETSTAPIVVRGRSPRNFQARKEIPLVGSSSSRGRPPELHVSTSTMSMIPALDGKPGPSRTHSTELMRAPFTFDSSSISGSPSMLRQPNYQSWSAAHTPDHATAPNTPDYPTSSVGMTSYFHVHNNSNPDLQTNTHSPSTSMPISQPPSRQYSYHPTSAPPAVEALRYMDSNPRPAKSPRHTALPRKSSSNYAEYESRFAPPYSSSIEAMPTRAPDYFPPSLQAWTTGTETNAVYGTASHAQGVPQYEFHNEQFVKDEGSVPHPNYTWSAPQ